MSNCKQIGWRSHDERARAAQAEMDAPDGEAARRSARLSELIAGEIESNDGFIGFDRYWELALYAPQLGYYTAGLAGPGARGDFMTAPELSALFSRCVARQVAEILEHLGPADVLEAGAGNGSMARDLLDELARLGVRPRRYLIVERAAAMRARQRALLGERCCDTPVTWLDELPPRGFYGVVLANELLDALPVTRFRIERGVVRELGVGHRQGHFAWKPTGHAPAMAGVVRDIERRAGVTLPDGYQSELGDARCDWVSAVAERLERGVILLFDYGYPRREYYRPDRTDGTLCCYHRHRMHVNPFILPGLQDISAHVEFSGVAQAGAARGLSVAGFTTQAQFLLGSGLVQMLQGAEPGSPRYLRMSGAVKHLILPGEMGELVKVLALARDVDAPLRGFSGRDMRDRLG